MPDMKEIGIYINCDKKNSIKLGLHCADYLQNKGIKVVMLSAQLQEVEIPGVFGYPKDDFFSKPDCIIILGGDGTLLGVARHASMYGVPLMGINLGKLGFLTEGEVVDLEPLLNRLCEGKFSLENRMMLQCNVKFENGKTEEHIALNDIVVKNDGFRMMEIKSYIDDAMVDTFYADGLIVASPTGSTAYSLAAGGPVVLPGTRVMLLNPICPHRLHDRTYVVSEKSVIRLEFNHKAHNLVAFADGQIYIPFGGRDQIEICVAEQSTKLIRMNDLDFFDRLRRKLSNDVKSF